MKLGLVARADDRGIGTMTWEFHRAMSPDRTLVVREPGAERRGFMPHLDRYPDATVVHFDPRGELSEPACREFLDGLDVVYLVETPYDFRFFDWARDAGCATVLHVMPEFWRWHSSCPRPDVWWLPTSWRAELLPDECRIVEVPVPIAPHRAPPDSTEPTFVHVAGHQALGDRNGTTLVLQASKLMRQRCTINVITQDARMPHVRTSTVSLQMRAGGVEDRWSLFDDAELLVLPRRYGGLCLPALEAMACGVGLVMSDLEPQRTTWPVAGVPTRPGRQLDMPCGRVTLHDTPPSELAGRLDQLVVDRGAVAELRERARAFARDHSWNRLRATYLDELGRACDRPLRLG